MLMALTHGKLSLEQANMEDILTSNVFGPLRYVPPEHGLLPFLSQATSDDCRKLDLPAVAGAKVEMRFWPPLQAEGCAWCEPDVLIRLTWPELTERVIDPLLGDIRAFSAGSI